MKIVKLSLNNFFWIALCLVACFIPAASTSAQVDAINTLPLFPKYLVMGVVYAPPGASSYVKYSNSQSVGSADSISSMQLTEKVHSTTHTGGGFLGIFGQSSGKTNTETWTNQIENSSSLSLVSTKGNSISTMGPISSALGVNHDNDVIYIWLDPVSSYTVNAPSPGISPLSWEGLSSNSCDLNAEQVTPYQEKVGCDPNQYPQPDIIGIPVWCLKNPYSPFQGCAQWLQYTSRSWDLSPWDVDPVTHQPSGPGLTLKDYADILRADPFVQLNGQAPNPCHPTYGAMIDPNRPETTISPIPLSSAQAALWVTAPDLPNSCGSVPQATSWNRFVPVGEVQFPVPGPNGLPSTYQGTLQYQASSQQTGIATDTHTVSYSKQNTNDYGQAFSGAVGAATIALAAIPGVGQAGAAAIMVAGALFHFNGSTSTTNGNTSTWQHQTSTSITSSTTNEADYVITGPQLSDNYTGPATFNVYQDNVYGTFAFYSPLEPQVTLGTICIDNCTTPDSFNWSSPVEVDYRGPLMQVTLTNNSVYPMTMAGPAVTFSDPGFIIDPSSDHCSNVVLVPGASQAPGFVAPAKASCTLNIVFAPIPSDAPLNQPTTVYASMVAAGTENASMSVSSATSPTTQDVLVVAQALVSGMVTPNPSDFLGATLLNNQNNQPDYSFPRATVDLQTVTYTLTSNYSAGVQLQNGIQGDPITLAGAGDFSISGSDCYAGRILYAGPAGTCHFTVQYLAQKADPAASHTATITVLGNPLTGSRAPVWLGGIIHLDGKNPPGQIDPQGYPITSVGTTSCSGCGDTTTEHFPVPIINNTPAPLTNIQITYDPYHNGWSPESDLSQCPASLAVNAQCTAMVWYDVPEDQHGFDLPFYYQVVGLSTDDGIHGTQYKNELSEEVYVYNSDPPPDPGFVTAIPTGNGAQVVAAGGRAQYSIQIAPTAKAYPAALTFSVDGLPNGATAGFDPATIAANAGPQAITLSIQTAKTTTGKLERPEWMEAGTLLCMLLLLPLPTLKRNRRLARLLMLAVTIFAGAAATVSLSGCGGSGSAAAAFNPNASNTYNIVVTIHSGAATKTMPLQLTIQ